MRYFTLQENQCEPFKKKMAEAGWPITHQDVGQTEILAYGYVIIWQIEDKKVMLNYEDRQGQVRANLEVSSTAVKDMETLLADLA